MDAEEARTVRRLARCRMMPGSWEKRFTRDMARRGPSHPLSPKQSAMVAKLGHKYRNQIAAMIEAGDA